MYMIGASFEAVWCTSGAALCREDIGPIHLWNLQPSIQPCGLGRERWQLQVYTCNQRFKQKLLSNAWAGGERQEFLEMGFLLLSQPDWPRSSTSSFQKKAVRTSSAFALSRLSGERVIGSSAPCQPHVGAQRAGAGSQAAAESRRPRIDFVPAAAASPAGKAGDSTRAGLALGGVGWRRGGRSSFPLRSTHLRPRSPPRHQQTQQFQLVSSPSWISLEFAKFTIGSLISIYHLKTKELSLSYFWSWANLNLMQAN